MFFNVVHAHPRTDSLNHALYRTIVGTLEEAGHEVAAIDLYRRGFQPAMTETERGSYHSGAYDDAEVAEFVSLLRRADGLIFCFPQWWYGMPAILKGYVDRVFAPGVAFTHDPAAGTIRPALTHIRHFGVVTSYGSPWWLARLVAGDPGRKVMMRALRPMCGSGARSFYLALYDGDRADAAARAAFMDKVRNRIEKIARAEA